MSEVALQWVQLVKILAIGAFAGLYAFGGVRGKWKRRIIAPATFIAGIIGFGLWTNTLVWSALLSVPLLFGALTMGYGATFLKDKIIKRARFGLACSVCSLSIFWAYDAWSLLPLHILLCVAMSVIAGVWNQTSSARAEETLIGASVVLIPYYII